MALEGEETCIAKDVLQKKAPHSGNNWYYYSTLLSKWVTKPLLLVTI